MRRGALLAALFLGALALRPQLVGIGPLIPAIQLDLHISHAVVGLLATIPVLCMGLFAPPAAFLSQRLGSRHALAAALALIGLFGIARAFGVVLLPGAGFLWAFLVGATIGPLFSLTMALPLDVGRGPADVAAYTGLILGAGYTLSAMSPFVLGAIRDASSSYNVVLWVIVGFTAALFIVDSSLTPARLSAARHGST